MLKQITIVYDPATCVIDSDNYDLLGQLKELLAKAEVECTIDQHGI